MSFFFFIKKKRIGSIILYLFKGININLSYSLVNLNGFATHKRNINIKIEGISYTFYVTIKKLRFFFLIKLKVINKLSLIKRSAKRELI